MKFKSEIIKAKSCFAKRNSNFVMDEVNMLYIEPLSFSLTINREANIAGLIARTTANVPEAVRYFCLSSSLNQYLVSTSIGSFNLDPLLFISTLNMLIIASE